MLSHFFILHFGIVIGFLLAALLVTQVLRERRSPAGTIAWLLVIIFVPYFGVPLYLLVGGRKRRSLVARRAQLLLPDIEDLPRSQAHHIDLLLRTYGLPGASPGHRFRLLSTGEETYRELVSLIESAQESIFIATFIWRPDEVGLDILNRLVSRAAQGVKVRLLLDGVGSFYVHRRSLRPLIRVGGRVSFFIPILYTPFPGRTNLRNHRKICLIDEKYVLAGGANLAEEYLGPAPKPSRWRDLSFILEGPAVQTYAEIFRSDWKFASGELLLPEPASSKPDVSPDPGVVAQVVPSGPDVPGDPLHDAILSAIFGAQRRLWVVTPYFVPDEALALAFTLAAHRGIDVRLIIPEKSNHSLADFARNAYLRQIQRAGGRIVLYPTGMVHAKAMVVDDELAMIGSANLDMRSLFLDQEVVTFVYSRSEVEATAAWIDFLMVEAQTADCQVGLFREIGESLIRVLAPLL